MSGMAAYERSHPAIVAEVRGADRSGDEYIGVVSSAALALQHIQNCPFDTNSPGKIKLPPTTKVFRANWAYTAPTRIYPHCPHDHLPEVYPWTFRYMDFDDQEEAVAQMRAWEEKARR